MKLEWPSLGALFEFAYRIYASYNVKNAMAHVNGAIPVTINIIRIGNEIYDSKR